MTNFRISCFFVATVGFVLAVAFALSPSTASADNRQRSKVRGSFDNTGVDSDAEGSFKGTFRTSRSKLRIKLEGLDPNISYELQVGGIPEASFAPDRRGRARLRFDMSPKNSRTDVLDFDPRGHTVTISDGVNDVLSMVASGPGEPLGIRVEERTLLVPGDPNCAGDEARTRFELRKDGRKDFRVKFDGVPPGAYELFVDGIERATLNVAPGDDDGKFEFRSPDDPPKLLLDFDPRGKEISILRGAQICFSGTLEAPANGMNVCDEAEEEVCLLAMLAAGEGEAQAEVETEDDCDMEFEVKVRAVPEGDLAVCVAGIFRGTIVVDTKEIDPNDPQDPNDPRIEYTSRIEFFKPHQEGKLALDFDVDLTQIEIREGDPDAQIGESCVDTTVLFSGVDLDCLPDGQVCEEEDISITLFNLGDPNASEATGGVRCEVDDDCDRKFRVTVEDLPAGDYDFLVDGFEGTITASADDPDEPEEGSGEIRFATSPNGSAELPFPAGFPDTCAGAEVTIVRGTTEFLSGTLLSE